jgi:hypothetical protein
MNVETGSRVDAAIAAISWLGEEMARQGSSHPALVVCCQELQRMLTTLENMRHLTRHVRVDTAKDRP